MKKLIVILLLALLTNCGMRKESQKVAELNAESAEVQTQSITLEKLTTELEAVKSTAKFQLSSQALELEALGEKPAIFSEIKGTDTIYKVIVQNGKLSRKNEQKDSSQAVALTNLHRELLDEKAENAILKQENHTQKEKITYLERDNTKLVKGLKYAAIIAVIAFLAWLFWKFKRFLKWV
ncbi:hypothetical protein EDL99_10190 [Ornithobacterium rhinotracheale]|uniref:hypothetical protein n=1 Tax=Ornithobacterium rhinotracheale TaxID=28251 RepID=UPI00129CBA37|nr:hypothetical protein [Ornithobacterium rhinotracheale]MRJ09225.1 hypothetical protein [Ornithobacterium rhinotracheale]UOH77294.1 hypothetical protein MT996_08750 [Ornithobacterium rhinotracheale]UOH78782.1 hypothetical protein MT996_04735 [Ornithobacterium rhinotracheale]